MAATDGDGVNMIRGVRHRGHPVKPEFQAERTATSAGAGGLFKSLNPNRGVGIADVEGGIVPPFGAQGRNRFSGEAATADEAAQSVGQQLDVAGYPIEPGEVGKQAMWVACGADRKPSSVDIAHHGRMTCMLHDVSARPRSVRYAGTAGLMGFTRGWRHLLAACFQSHEQS